MKRFLLPLLCPLGLLAASPAAAQEPQPPTGRPPAAQEHDVRRGDTLWDLAGQYLGNPFRWPEIWELNRHIVADPHRIYPRESLRIPGYNYPASPEAQQDSPPGRTVFFPDDAQRMGGGLLLASDASLQTAITEGDFYRAGFLSAEAVAALGTLVEVLSPTVLPGRLDPQVGLYDRVYVKLSDRGRSGLRLGDRVHFWRPGREVPTHGRIFESTGLATVVALDADVATVEVDRFFDAIRVGDLALPVREFTVPAGAFPSPASGLEGRLLAFEEPHALHAIHDLAFVDLGERSGVREGDEFEVVLPPTRVSWGVRPEIPIARLRVIRTEGGTSAVRVIHLDQPALEPGLPIRLVGKMP